MLPADTTLINGVGILSVTLSTAGSQTLTAADTMASSRSGTNTAIIVSPLPASHFSISGIPANTTAGATFEFTVVAEDVFNNTATSFSSSVQFSSSDHRVVMPARGMLTSGQGVFSAPLRPREARRLL